MSREEAISELGFLLERELPKIVRHWARRLVKALGEPLLGRPAEKEHLAGLLEELRRLLAERGESAPRLWPESLRGHAVRRRNQGFGPAEVAREWSLLEQVLLDLIAKERGGMPLPLHELISELLGEAVAELEDAFFAAVRSERASVHEGRIEAAALEELGVGVLVADQQGVLIDATPAVERLFGLPVSAWLGPRGPGGLARTLERLEARDANGAPFHPEALPYVRTLANGRSLRGVELRIRRTNGTAAVLELASAPLYDEGERVGASLLVRDRSEHAARTQALFRASEDLRRLQGKLLATTSVQTAGRLAGGAAHAASTVLNALRLRVALLRKEPTDAHFDALDKAIAELGEQVGRLRELAAPPVEEAARSCELDVLVEDAVALALAGLFLPPPPITIERKLTSEGFVRVAPTAFRGVVVDLLLAVRTRLEKGGRAEIRTERVARRVRMVVEDDGPSYSDEALAGLFEPFPAGPSETQVSLWLSAARDQLRGWGGELECENRPGVGVRFTLGLPAVAAEERWAEREDAAPRAPGGHEIRRVLVVDDDPEGAELLATLLEDEGFSPEVARSGKEALAAWERAPFDAALLDVRMPDLSGWWLARRIRERAPGTMVAMLTGGDVVPPDPQTRKAVDAIFRKPVDLPALRALLGSPGTVQTGPPQPSTTGRGPPVPS